MTLTAHGIVDCTGFEVVKCLPWDLPGGETDDRTDRCQASKRSNWGISICRPPESMTSGDESDVNRLHGVVGQLQTDHVQETCLGVLLNGELDPLSALSHFALACGLSIIDRAKLELGDTIVVAGANLLALSVLVAADGQGARTACLVPDSETATVYRRAIERLASEVIEFKDISSFDARLDVWVASSIGNTVYVDAIGQPSSVYAMATRLARFGKLVFGRQEVTASVELNIADVHHRRSAQFIYWARPENLEEALTLAECYRRAVNLFRWRRISTLLEVASARPDASSARERE